MQDLSWIPAASITSLPTNVSYDIISHTGVVHMEVDKYYLLVPLEDIAFFRLRTKEQEGREY